MGHLLRGVPVQFVDDEVGAEECFDDVRGVESPRVVDLLDSGHGLDVVWLV